MNVKMMVFDLDNTLLNNFGELTDFTINILNKIKIKKVIATSRVLNNTSLFAKKIDANDIIFSSGSGILYKDESIKYNLLRFRDVEEILKKVINKDKTIRILIKTKDDHYSNYYNNFSKKLKIDYFDNDYIEKITLETEKLEKVKEILLEYECLNFDFVTDDKVIITDKRAGKVNSVLDICAKYNISKEEVLIFGDGLNDLELFKTFENSIAVMNAKEEVKELAKYICLDSLHDGVARWLNTNYLNNRVNTIIKKGSASDIEIDTKERIVKKKISLENEGISNGYTKLFYEMKHMIDFNKRVYDIYPNVYSIKDIDNNLVCTMEYLYDGINFSDLIKDDNISIDTIKKSLNFVLDGLFSNIYLTKDNVEVNPCYIFDNYINRAKTRLDVTLNLCKNKGYDSLREIIKNGVILNGIKYPSYYKYLEFIMKDNELLDRLSIKYNTESHQDLIFSNIMVDYNTLNNCIDDFKLIDPRGELETGASNRHFMYDVGKMLFCVNGFDLIRMMFEDNVNNIGSYYAYYDSKHYNIEFEFNDDNVIIKKYNATYEAILEYFKNNKYECFDSLELLDNYEVKFLFAESINFIADVACRVNNDNKEEIAMCFYLRGIKTMSDFFVKVYGKDIVKEKLK